MDNCKTQISPFDKDSPIKIPSPQLLRWEVDNDIFTFDLEESLYAPDKDETYEKEEADYSV